MSKYLIRKIKVDDEFIDIYAQAEAEDVKFFIDKGNNRYEESTVQAVLEQIGADIKEIKENMDFVSGGGSTVIQPVSFGGTGADNTVQASLNLRTAYLGEIPYGIEAMAFLTEETIDNNNPPGAYRYVNSADLGEVPVFIQPVDILTGEEIGLPFVEEIRAYSEGIITVDENTYAVEDYELVAEVQIPVTVYTTEITVKIPYKRVSNLTYTVYWYGETGLDTGEYELLKQETRGGAGFEADQTVSVTATDKVIEGYYEFDEESSNNVLSIELSGESNNVLKLYFKAIPEPVYSNYTVKMFNSVTGEELVGDFTSSILVGIEITYTFPEIIAGVETGTIITVGTPVELHSETRTYNYKEDDERNVTTLTIVEDPEANIFKFYYEMVPVYADVNVEFINVITSEEITGTFDKCQIYDYTSIPESLGEISVPATFTAEVDSTVTAEAYAFDLFDSDSNTGYIYDRPNTNNISSLVVSETETNTLKLYFVPVVINPIVPYVQYSVRWETESGVLLPVSLKNPNPESRLGESGSIVGLTESDIASIEGVEPLSYSEDITLTEGENNTLSVVFPDSILSDEPEVEPEIETYSLDTLGLTSTFAINEASSIDLINGTVYILNQEIDYLNTKQTQLFIGDIHNNDTNEFYFGIFIRSLTYPKFEEEWLIDVWTSWEQIYPSTGGGVSEVTPDTFTGILPVEKGGTGVDSVSQIANALKLRTVIDDSASLKISAGSDLNTYKTPGTYWFEASHNIANKPAINTSNYNMVSLEVFRIGNRAPNVLQVATGYTGGTFIRYATTQSSNEIFYSDWIQTSFSGKIPADRLESVSSLTDGTNTYKFGQDSGGVYIEIE